MLPLQQKPQPTTTMAAASSRASTSATMVLWWAESTSTRLGQMLKGKQQVQIDCSCSLSPLATQLLEFNQTRMLNSRSPSVRMMRHSICGNSSTISNSEMKYSPTPMALLWVKLEQAGSEWIESTPKERSLVALGAYELSMRTCLLTAQGTTMSQLSPEMNSLGLFCWPNLNMRRASSIQLQYLFSLKASSGLTKDSLRQSSATYLRPLYWQIRCTVDRSLLMLEQSQDQSWTIAILKDLSSAGRKATNWPLSVRAQYLPWSGRASVKKAPVGCRNSLLSTALVELSRRWQTRRAEFQAMKRMPKFQDWLKWQRVNLRRSFSSANAQSYCLASFWSTGMALKLLKLWQSTEASLTPSVTMTLPISAMTTRVVSRASELLRPRLVTDTCCQFLKMWVLLNWYRTRNRLASLLRAWEQVQLLMMAKMEDSWSEVTMDSRFQPFSMGMS